MYNFPDSCSLWSLKPNVGIVCPKEQKADFIVLALTGELEGANAPSYCW